LKPSRYCKVAKLREDSNFLLTTILWGNVGINVLLTLLSNSVMVGAVAFLFSTFVITFFGEIIPQAYFSRHALKVASLLSPALRFYQILLFPEAKPSAVVLDKWLGPEAVQFIKEKDIILFWGNQKRIITGSDILGRLMRGIVQNIGIDFKKILRKET